MLIAMVRPISIQRLPFLRIGRTIPLEESTLFREMRMGILMTCAPSSEPSDHIPCTVNKSTTAKLELRRMPIVPRPIMVQRPVSVQ